MSSFIQGFVVVVVVVHFNERLNSLPSSLIFIPSLPSCGEPWGGCSEQKLGGGIGGGRCPAVKAPIHHAVVWIRHRGPN